MRARGLTEREAREARARVVRRVRMRAREGGGVLDSVVVV
jgi:hypothetical protein